MSCRTFSLSIILIVNRVIRLNITTSHAFAHTRVLRQSANKTPVAPSRIIIVILNIYLMITTVFAKRYTFYTSCTIRIILWCNIHRYSPIVLNWHNFGTVAARRVQKFKTLSSHPLPIAAHFITSEIQAPS